MEQEVRIGYDGIFKKCFELYPKESVIEFINSLFDRNYPLDAKVERISTESHDENGNELRSDKLCKINGDMYHFEVQSGDDSNMILRVYEYSYWAAKENQKNIKNGIYELDFPESVVIYLRSTAKTPKNLKMILNLPNNKKAEYEVRTLHSREIQLTKLTEKSMLALFPFRPLKYEKDKDVQKMESDVLFMIEDLSKSIKGDEANKELAEFAVDSLKKITKNVMEKLNIDEREVNRFMEATNNELFVIEPLQWEARGVVKGRTEGIAIGETKNKIETAKKMFAKGADFSFVQEVTDLNPDVLKKLQAEAEKEMNAGGKIKASIAKASERKAGANPPKKTSQKPKKDEIDI